MTRGVLAKVRNGLAAELNSDAFKAFLQTREFAVQFEAVPSYADWQDDDALEDCGCLKVDVVAVELEGGDLETRESIDDQATIDIGFRYRFGKEDQQQTGDLDIGEIDNLMYLVESTRSYLLAEYLTADEEAEALGACAVTAKIRASWIREHLRKKRQFTGIIRIPYDVETPLP